MPKDFVGEPFCAVFQKNSGSEKFMDKRGGELSRFSIEKFLFHSAESFPRGSLYCCNNFRYRKNLDKSGGSIKIFRGKFFCLTVPKNFVGEPFCAVFQKNSGSEKFMDKRGGEFQDFQSKNSAEKFRRGSLCRVGELLQ